MSAVSAALDHSSGRFRRIEYPDQTLAEVVLEAIHARNATDTHLPEQTVEAQTHKDKPTRRLIKERSPHTDTQREKPTCYTQREKPTRYTQREEPTCYT